MIIKKYSALNIINKQQFANKIFNDFKYLKEISILNHNIKSIIELLNNDTIIINLLIIGNKIIGYLVAEIKNIDVRYITYIDYIYIDPNFRNYNLGTILINDIIKYTKMNDIKFVLLTFDISNNKLKKFYKKFGFKKDKQLINNINHKVYSLMF